MFVSKHTLKRLSGGIAIAAFVVVVAVPSALASSFITDTLGGNGSPKASTGVSFITDTLGGNGSPKATPDAVERAVAIHNAQAQRAVDHYLGLHAATQPYVNGGMSPAVATSNERIHLGVPTLTVSTGGAGFNWGDAGIGAGFVAGLALLLLIGGPRLRGHKGRVLAA
jgi:hypothetical protein